VEPATLPVPGCEVGLRRPLAALLQRANEIGGRLLLGRHRPRGHLEVFDVVFPDWLQSVLVLLLVPQARIERAARVAREPRGAPRPADETLDDARIAEQQPQASELIVDQRVHRVEDHRPNSARFAELLSPLLGLRGELAEDREKEALSLARAGAGYHDEAPLID